MLAAARVGARLQFRQIAAVLGVHPRTIARWEVGESHPSKEQWNKTIAYLARFVPAEAAALAKAAGVVSPLPVSVPVDSQAIEEAILRAADLLDVSPRRVRAAVREIVKATRSAGGTLADLARATEEKVQVPGGKPPEPPDARRLERVARGVAGAGGGGAAPAGRPRLQGRFRQAAFAASSHHGALSEPKGRPGRQPAAW